MMAVLSRADRSATDPKLQDNYGMTADASFHADREKCYAATEKTDCAAEEVAWNNLWDRAMKDYGEES